MKPILKYFFMTFPHKRLTNTYNIDKITNEKRKAEDPFSPEERKALGKMPSKKRILGHFGALSALIFY